MRRPISRCAVLLLCVLCFAPCASETDLKFPPPTKEQRTALIRRARVWEPANVSKRDLYNGPRGALDFDVDQEITCNFVPQSLDGWTEKFLCRLDDGRIVKVKYVESDRYKEAYGEVLGTRLFWALGFHTDRALPVRVTCRDCPRKPWTYVNAGKNKDLLDEAGKIGPLPAEAEVGTWTFDPAAIEERLDGAIIEREKDEGWRWSSLALIDESAGGASKAEIDALRLLNAFVINSDNKHTQNAFVCPRSEIVKDAAGHVTCGRPVMYVSDLGAVFGKGGFLTGYEGRVDYEGWKKRSVWKNERRCTAWLLPIGGIWRPSTLRHPRVSEEGRALLARQLGALSDDQIADLFRAARIERLHQTMSDPSSGEREVTLKDWVELFKKKRDEITKHPGCPPRGRD